MPLPPLSLPHTPPGAAVRSAHSSSLPSLSVRLGGQAHGHAELVLALVEVDRLNLRDEREQRQRRELLLEAGEELAVRVDLAEQRARSAEGRWGEAEREVR